LKMSVERLVRGVGKYKGQAMVNGEVVAEAELICVLKTVK
jgi:3-hydroxyacyl-[acyl-carrier-protein] dehydratase